MPRRTTREVDVEIFLQKPWRTRLRNNWKNKQVFSQGQPDTVFTFEKGRVAYQQFLTAAKKPHLLMGSKDFVGDEGVAFIAYTACYHGHAAAIADGSMVRIQKSTMLSAEGRSTGFLKCLWLFFFHASPSIRKLFPDTLQLRWKAPGPRAFATGPNTGRTAWLNQQYLKMSHEVLAEMVGTTHARIGFFMNCFRKIGFIHYKGGLEVHSSLLNAFLHEWKINNAEKRCRFSQHLFSTSVKATSSAAYCPLAADSIPAVEMSRSMEWFAFPMSLPDWQRCPEQM
jgi:CRP/FNR family transcriptional regulator, cyclic AMP receptor protein